LRRATAADAEALAASVVEGVEGYREFAGEDWPGFALEDEIASFQELVRLPDVWALMAEQDGELLGQVTIQSSETTRMPLGDPGLGHLRNLFVRQDQWGTGLARRLHDAAVEEARRRGYRELRLFAAAGQARARRFYEREGWALAGEPAYDPRPGLVMAEYRLMLF
jgi:GNAT superfamily N-acetyltransferase